MSNFLSENGVFENIEQTGLLAKGVSTRVWTQKGLFDQPLKNQCCTNRNPNRTFKNKILDK